MKKTLIRGAKVVNEGTLEKLDILIHGDTILKIGVDINEFSDVIIDARGLYALPGLIDDQVHFREPGLTHKATIESESKAAIAGGITSFIEMPNTTPQTTTHFHYRQKMKIAKETSWANYGFMFGGTNDNLDEILKIDPKTVPALKLFLGSSTGNMLVDDPQVLESIFSKTRLPIAVHCEDEATIRANLKLKMEEFGEDIPLQEHPNIRSEEACYKSSSRAVKLAKKTNARLHVFHLSTAKETQLFESKKAIKEKNITAEVCIHHLWFSDEDYASKGTHIKWNPAVKTTLDRDGLWTALIDGRIDIIATDHAPHTLNEKNNVYTKAPSGGPMVQHALLVLLECFKKGKISLELIVEKMCHNPALLFDIDKRGYLREGYFADIVLVDLEAQQKVTKSSLLYQCGWSPLEGTTFHSKITHTFVNGNLAYQLGKISSKPNVMALTFDR